MNFFKFWRTPPSDRPNPPKLRQEFWQQEMNIPSQSLSNSQKKNSRGINAPIHTNYQELTDDEIEAYARDAARKLNTTIKLPSHHANAKITNDSERSSNLYSNSECVVRKSWVD